MSRVKPEIFVSTKWSATKMNQSRQFLYFPFRLDGHYRGRVINYAVNILDRRLPCRQTFCHLSGEVSFREPTGPVNMKRRTVACDVNCLSTVSDLLKIIWRLRIDFACVLLSSSHWCVRCMTQEFTVKKECPSVTLLNRWLHHASLAC